MFVSHGGVREPRAVEFSGEFERSQLVVGDHNTVHRYEGTVVQVSPQGSTPEPRPAERPQTRLPRAGEQPIGRDNELHTAWTALAGDQPSEFYGPPGIGKSVLLRRLARESGRTWADGTVHARVAGQPLEDVLQWLFEVFWTSDPHWAPGPLRVGEYLRDLRALIILDDVDFSSDEVASLLDQCSQSTFLLAGTQAHLDPMAHTIALRGLPSAAGVAAFERCLGRSLDDAERARVTHVAMRLEGMPALVLEAARMIRDGLCSFEDLDDSSAAELARRRVVALSGPQLRLLALLAELAPSAVPTRLLTAASGAASSDLETLESNGLVEAGSPRYALARPLPSATREELPAMDAEPILVWLTRTARAGTVDEDAMPAAVATLEWGLRMGMLDAVVDAARELDPALLRSRQTGAWGEAIGCGAAAARESGRAADEAFFLHQQGTRWMCLGDTDRAEGHLRPALELRQRLGDDLGIACTTHNLEVLHGGAAGWHSGNGDRKGANGTRGSGHAAGSSPSLSALWPWGLATLGAIIGLGVGVALGNSGGAQTTVTTAGEPAKITRTTGGTATATSTDTATNTEITTRTDITTSTEVTTNTEVTTSTEITTSTSTVFTTVIK